MQEAARILKPGGVLCFTDIMQVDNVDTAKLTEVRPLGLLVHVGTLAFDNTLLVNGTVGYGPFAKSQASPRISSF